MAVQALPDHLTLQEFPVVDQNLKKSSVPQAIEIALTGGTSIHELVNSLRECNAPQVVLGKKPAVILDGGKTVPVRKIEAPQNLLFKLRPRSNKLELSAAFNLKDGTARSALPGSSAQTLDLNDPALLALQQGLAQHAQNKESNTTVFVKDSSKLPPPKSGKAALQASKLLKPHRQGLFDRKGAGGASRSGTASPSLGAVTPPVCTMKTADQMEQEAIKNSLIHLLAVRAVSKAYLLKRINCKPEKLEPMLEKYGRPSRLDANKLDLSDRGFRELDVWNFHYTDPEDRQAAIDRAITAYDRQRISVVEKVWQMLLPKEQRNKGKVLSKLNLHAGPIERVKTPQIQVESTAGSRQPSISGSPEADGTRGHLAPSTARSVPRPTAQGQSKKQKATSGLESLTKTISKNKSLPKTKEPEKAKPAETSKVTNAKRGAPKKATGPTSSKVKSAEFVHDSDEDLEMEDAPAVKPDPVGAKPPTKKTAGPTAEIKAPRSDRTKKVTPAPALQKPAPTKQPVKDEKASLAKDKGLASKKLPASTGLSTATKGLPHDTTAQKASVPMSRSVSHKRTSSSPIKPSPLGSSPPTNASDLDNDNAMKSKSSSSSNSPLINQRRHSRPEISKKPAPTNKAKVPATSVPAANAPTTATAQKRKAENALNSHARSVATDRSNAAPKHAEPAARPAKRQQVSSSDGATSTPTPPPTSSDRSATGSARSPLLSQENLEYSRRFKEQQSRYASMLRDLSALADPPPERVEKLQRMYEKLSEHKAQIWKLAAV